MSYEAHLSWYHSRFIGDGGTPTYVHETLCMGASVRLLYWPTSPICWVLYVVWTSSLLELAQFLKMSSTQVHLSALTERRKPYLDLVLLRCVSLMITSLKTTFIIAFLCLLQVRCYQNLLMQCVSQLHTRNFFVLKYVLSQMAYLIKLSHLLYLTKTGHYISLWLNSQISFFLT